MNRPATPDLRVETALLILLGTLWGSSYLYIKIAVAEIPPVTLIAFRTALAGALLAGVALWRGERFPRDIAVWRQLGLQALLMGVLAWTLLAWGQQRIDSALASVLNSTTPIFVIVYTVFITRHESVTARRLAGAALGMTGVVLIVGVEALSGLGRELTGQLAAVGAAALYGVAAIYGKRFDGLPPTVAAAGTMLCAAAVLVPASLLVDAPWTLRPSPQAAAAALALALLSTALAFVIYYRLMATLGSAGVVSQAFLRPVIGALIGLVFLGERISLTVGIGLVLAILGVAAINFRWPAVRAAPRSGAAE